MNNPDRILRTLDSHLQRETRIVLFGRAALAVGFSSPNEPFGATHDVDAILPSIELSRIEADGQFWDAIEKTNKELQAAGLYLSHLFTDEQVILTPNWLERIVNIPSDRFRFLKLSRPDSIDLILTKMMRNDREDIRDIRFILQHDIIDTPKFLSALESARIPRIPEINAIFVAMRDPVIGMAKEVERSRRQPLLNNEKGGIELDWWTRLTDGPLPRREREKGPELEM